MQCNWSWIIEKFGPSTSHWWLHWPLWFPMHHFFSSFFQKPTKLLLHSTSTCKPYSRECYTSCIPPTHQFFLLFIFKIKTNYKTPHHPALFFLFKVIDVGYRRHLEVLIVFVKIISKVSSSTYIKISINQLGCVVLWKWWFRKVEEKRLEIKEWDSFEFYIKWKWTIWNLEFYTI